MEKMYSFAFIALTQHARIAHIRELVSRNITYLTKSSKVENAYDVFLYE